MQVVSDYESSSLLDLFEILEKNMCGDVDKLVKTREPRPESQNLRLLLQNVCEIRHVARRMESRVLQLFLFSVWEIFRN